jgi:transposase
VFGAYFGVRSGDCRTSEGSTFAYGILKTLGHTVRLMPPAYVKPYVKRQKNDATDAEAICEAVTRANMRFVESKTPE